jgi:hypothetical protein
MCSISCAPRQRSLSFGHLASARPSWLDPQLGESDDARLLRQKLVPFVASVGGQKELIEHAEKLARSWLKTHNGISPEMVRPVLEVAAEFGIAIFSIFSDGRRLKSAIIAFART